MTFQGESLFFSDGPPFEFMFGDPDEVLKIARSLAAFACQARGLNIRSEAARHETSGGETDVHTQHCCRWHGCKYGDDDCPVEKRKLPQSFPCEDCEEEEQSYKD